jgi:hypothetical protein
VNTRTKFIGALSMALAFAGLLGCGTSNHLQSITLTAGSTTGTVEVKGIGGTLQLVATGNYSSGKTHDLSHVVTYTVTPTGTDVNTGGPLPTPPLGASISPTGLITAELPAVCTFTYATGSTPPAYSLTGSYQVVATFEGIVSQPMYIAMASATGDGPSGACGP